MISFTKTFVFRSLFAVISYHIIGMITTDHTDSKMNGAAVTAKVHGLDNIPTSRMTTNILKVNNNGSSFYKRLRWPTLKINNFFFKLTSLLS